MNGNIYFTEVILGERLRGITADNKREKREYLVSNILLDEPLRQTMLKGVLRICMITIIVAIILVYCISITQANEDNDEPIRVEKSSAEGELILAVELDSLRKENVNLLSKLMVLKITKEKIEGKLKAQISNLKKEKSTLNNKLTTLKKSKEGLEVELNQQISTLQKGNYSLNTRLSALETVRSELESKITALNSELSTLEGSKNAIVSQLEKEVASLKNSETRLKNAEAKLATIEQEKKELERRLRNDLATLKKDKEEMEKELSNRAREKADIEVNKLGSELAALAQKSEEAERISPEEMEPGKTKEVLEKGGARETSGIVIGKDLQNREIWIDFGGNNGVVEGQSFAVYRNNGKIAVLKAIKVFSSFTVTETLAEEDFANIEELDKVRMTSIDSSR